MKNGSKIKFIKKRFYVYALLDPRKQGKYKYGKYKFDHEPFYIGKGCGNRINRHTQPNLKKKNTFKSNVIKKIEKNGMEVIKTKILDKLTEENALEVESHFIRLIGKRVQGKGPLTNYIEDAISRKGYKHTEKTKEKISLNNAKYWLGKKKSQLVKEKISATKHKQFKNNEIVSSMKGKKHSSEAKEKMRRSRLGKKWNDEQKAHLSDIRKKHKNRCQTKYWKLTSPDGKIYKIYGLGEFCRNNNLSQGHLWSVSKGLKTHHKGWKCSKIT